MRLEDSQRLRCAALGAPPRSPGPAPPRRRPGPGQWPRRAAPDDDPAPSDRAWPAIGKDYCDFRTKPAGGAGDQRALDGEAEASYVVRQRDVGAEAGSRTMFRLIIQLSKIRQVVFLADDSKSLCRSNLGASPTRVDWFILHPISHKIKSVSINIFKIA